MRSTRAIAEEGRSVEQVACEMSETSRDYEREVGVVNGLTVVSSLG